MSVQEGVIQLKVHVGNCSFYETKDGYAESSVFQKEKRQAQLFAKCLPFKVLNNKRKWRKTLGEKLSPMQFADLSGDAVANGFFFATGIKLVRWAQCGRVMAAAKFHVLLRVKL